MRNYKRESHLLPESIPKPQLKLASIITFMFIPFATDGGTYGYGYLGHPMDGISAHSTVNIANPFAAPDAEAFLRSGPLLLDDGWINSSPSGIPANTHDHQVNPESACIWQTGEWSSTVLLESPTTSTHDGEFPVVRPSETADCMASTYFLLTLGESEGFGQAPVALNEAPTLIDPADVPNSCHESAFVSLTSDQGLYTCVDTTPFLSGSSSTVSEISHTPTVVQGQEQGVSRARTRSIFQTGKGLTAASSRTSRRPGGIRGAPKGPNSCSVQGCKKKDKPYKHLSGLRRHYRDKHCEPSLCMHCDRDVFEWTRPYQLKDHLEKQHPNADHNAALVEAKRARRRATI